MTFLPLLFPDGRLPSRRWRPVAWAAAVNMAVLTVYAAFAPRPLEAPEGCRRTLAIGIAILRYRLYDIDRLINRTVVYGALTALLGVVYGGAVLIGGQVFGGLGAQPPSWAVAGATLAAELLAVVDQTMEPTSASLWLRPRRATP